MSPQNAVFMERALELAARGWGNTSPNPMVGAVLVRNGRIIAEGYHTQDGAPHAEIECLKACERAGESPEGATMFVTLEPCSTHGRTGACCDALIKAKVGEVVISALDPNPVHAGRGVKILLDAGIKCSHGLLEGKAKKLNFIYNKAVSSGKAALVLKYAVSSDGKITAKRGVHTQITQRAAAENAMHYRKLFAAMGVGFGTLVADNPKLTARAQGHVQTCKTRLIFDSALRSATLDLEKYNVFSDSFAHLTRIVVNGTPDPVRRRILEDRGVKITVVDVRNETEFWDKLKTMLYAERINSVCIEGGASLYASVCRAHAADFVFEYRSKEAVLGSNALAAFDKPYFEIKNPQTEDLDADILTRGELSWIR